ncbi:UNVERIFIED_CONTAM: Proton pump-interactor 1 [Sesamum radiatum]|uniref:Proton pump-interactor 1 n=1 Tax=Sesamum radiatum TaxID=300843 RepID=A0AAW2LQM7_SESRA
MEPLQQALGKLRGAGPRERGSGLCSSEEELNDLIKSLHYRIQHESIPLSEEKQILREIKQLEGTREKVIAIAAERARIQDSLGEKQAIQDQNSPFYQNRTILSKAKVIAAQKDAEAVKELTRSEVEKFMSVWNSNKAFRDDYESRILQSLDMRLLSKDGRIRNPGETPLMLPETPLPSETDTVVKKSVKQVPKENSVSPLQDSAPPEQTEREKRARKKAGAAVPTPNSEEPSETVPEVTEPEKAEENTETPATQKNNDRKEHSMRHRPRPRAPNALPKAILKRKKATKDWLWVTVPAAVLVIVLLVVGYNYLS